MFHDETIYRDGSVAGRINPVAYGHSFDRLVGTACLRSDRERILGAMVGVFEAERSRPKR